MLRLLNAKSAKAISPFNLPSNKPIKDLSSILALVISGGATVLSSSKPTVFGKPEPYPTTLLNPETTLSRVPRTNFNELFNNTSPTLASSVTKFNS